MVFIFLILDFYLQMFLFVPALSLDIRRLEVYIYNRTFRHLIVTRFKFLIIQAPQVDSHKFYWYRSFHLTIIACKTLLSEKGIFRQK